MLLALALLAVVGYAPPALAQTAWETRTWDARDGLPNLTVTALAHDAHGYLWVGTESGLVRFDGYRLVAVPVRPGAAGALQDGYVRALHALPGGDLLVGTSRGGVQRYDARSGTIDAWRLDPSAPTGGAEDFTCGFATAPGGRVYVGTGESLWEADVEARTARRLYRIPAAHASGLCLLAPHAGAVWAVSEQKAVRVDAAGGVQEVDVLPQATALVATRGGALVVGGRGVVQRRVAGGGWQRLTTVPGDVRALAEAADGALWIGTDRGLFRWHAGTREDVTAPLPYPFVRALHADATGTVWAGVFSGGLVALTPPPPPMVDHVTLPGGRPLRSGIKSFTRDACGVLWMGAFREGLTYDLQDAVPTCAPRGGVPPELQEGGIYALAGDADGGLWVARFDRGLAYYTPRTGRVAGPEVFGLPGDVLPRDVLLDARQRVWLADATKGVYRYDPATSRVRHWAPGGLGGFPHPFAWAMVEGSGGVVYVATTGGGVARYDPATDAFTTLSPATTPALPDARVLGLALEQSGALWAGLFGTGLARIEPAFTDVQHWPAPGGVPNGMVSNVHVDADGRVWLTSHAGLSVLDPATGHLGTFGPREGMARLPAFIDALWADRDGTVYVGTPDGYVRFHPRDLTPPGAAPAPRITEVWVGKQGVAPHARVRLSYDHAPLHLRFASMPVAHPEEVGYEVRLDGLDTLWTAVDGSDVTYARLPPGAYTVQVRAVQRGSRVASAATPYSFTVTPPVWARGWFRAAVMAVLALLVYALHRARVAHLLALEHTRRRIADDLHDDLGARLATLAGRLELAHAQQAPASAAPLRPLARQARDLTHELRDLVWLIDGERETLLQLVDRFEMTAYTLLEGQRLTIERAEALPDVVLDPDTRRHLLLIVKEALRNALEHAPGARIILRVGCTPAGLEVDIEDAGPGFDPAAVRAGRGTTTLRRRAAAIGATLTLDSAVGAGTRVRLRWPLPG